MTQLFFQLYSFAKQQTKMSIFIWYSEVLLLLITLLLYNKHVQMQINVKSILVWKEPKY